MDYQDLAIAAFAAFLIAFITMLYFAAEAKVSANASKDWAERAMRWAEKSGEWEAEAEIWRDRYERTMLHIVDATEHMNNALEDALEDIKADEENSDECGH